MAFLETVKRGLLVLVLGLSLCACLSNSSRVRPEDNVPTGGESDGEWAAGATFEGEASWYGEKFHGRLTANGETFDMNALSAAHKTLPLGSTIRVTNLANDRSVDVRVNDRGPYAGGRVLDLSKAAADRLGFLNQGTARVRAELLDVGDNAYAKQGVVAEHGDDAASEPSDSSLETPEDGETAGKRIRIGPYSSRWKAERIFYYLRGRYESAEIYSKNEEFYVFIGPFTTEDVRREIFSDLDREGYDPVLD